MNTIKAAYFSGISLLVAASYAVIWLRPGLSIGTEGTLRHVWISSNSGLWSLGWWLWLLTIFAWMMLLVTLMWAYLPAHRVVTMLQSGLMIIAAVFMIGAVLIWMNVFAIAAVQDDTHHIISLVDTFALSFLGAGSFMGGTTTAWIAIDLIRLTEQPKLWVVPGILAGTIMMPAPFLLPDFWLLVPALVFWLLWCVVLTFHSLPSRYPEYEPTHVEADAVSNS